MKDYHCYASKEGHYNLKERQNLKTFSRQLKSNLGSLNQVNFAKRTTFNRNKDIVNYVYC